MLIGVISDVHANLPALEAVLNEGDRLGIQNWLCLGDIIGYYYWPKECLESVRQRGAIVIAGNHERMTYIARSDNEYYTNAKEHFGYGFQLSVETLPQSDINWIERLPHKLELQLGGKKILMCHGSPWNADVYVYPDADNSIRHRMAADGFDLVFYGHTHYPVNWQIGSSLICNPGSVGQPRNYQPGAHWAIWDSNKCKIIHRSESYDITMVLEASRYHDPHISYLQNVLVRTHS